MKQTLFMIAATMVGLFGSLTVGPFIGVATYYLFAVLRPQYMWVWALPDGVAWSQFVAIGTIVGSAGMALGLIPVTGALAEPFKGFSRVTWCYMGFGLWVCLTYLTAMSQNASWPWFIEYLKIFLMLFVASTVVRTTNHVWWIYRLTTGALIYIAYEINYKYIETGRIYVYHNGYGGLDNNGAGLMLAMGVPLAVYAWEGSRRLWRWAFLAGVPVLLHAVLMTYSRGAMVSLLVVTPILAFRSKRRWQFAGMALALALSVPMLAGEEIRQRFFSVNQYESDGSANARFDSWRAAIAIANDYPIFGVGIRNSGLIVFDYGADMVGRTIHSQYLQLAADSGYPALALYFVALGSVWLSMSQARRMLKARDDDEAALTRAMISGLEASLGVFCVGSIFLSLEVFELPYLLALLGGQTYVVVRAAAGPAVSASPVGLGARDPLSPPPVHGAGHRIQS